MNKLSLQVELNQFFELDHFESLGFERKLSLNKKNKPLTLGLNIPGQLITIDAKNLLRFK